MKTVSLNGIVKHFGRITALDRADFSAQAGRISALVGENGAGKTTLMRILAGRISPDAGVIEVDGKPLRFSSPREAAAAGIGMVDQDARVIRRLTVFENVILGAEESRRGFVSRTSASRVRDLCESLSLSADLDAPAESLSAPERQRLAIVRALYRGAQCLILDEPTSLLGPSERASLFDTMRRLAASGAVVIFISHKLSEVFDVSDSITVLRCGHAVLECETQRASPTQVAVAMVGESVSAEPALASAPSDTLVKLSDVSTSGEGRDSLRSVSLDLRRGEVVGIAGVAGNGQRALADVVLGIARPVAGSVSYPRGKPDAGFVGDDISAMDLIPPMRVWENRILGREGGHARWWGIPVAAVKRDTERLAKEFGVRGDVDAPVSALSGGNRQRLALARELDAAPSLLVVEEPSRGLDIRGAELIRRRIRQAAASGAAVLLISYDLDELYALSDRILVISSGRLLEPSSQPPLRAELGQLMTH